MKLTELEPEFVYKASADGSFWRISNDPERPADAPAHAQGIWFLCPRCFVRQPPEGVHSILVWFADRGVPAECKPAPRWTVSGTSLADLTIFPSIDLTREEPGIVYTPEQKAKIASEWHGFVTKGEVT